MRSLPSRLATVLSAVALALPLTAGAAVAKPAQTNVKWDSCSSVFATSSKDISNVVLRFLDGDTQRFEDGDWGTSGTFSGSGSNAGETISVVWVKSGDNHSGEGSGYGERHDTPLTCDESADRDTTDADAGSTPAESDDDDDAGSTPAKGDDDDDAGSTPAEGDDDDDAGSTPAEGDDDDDAGSTPAEGDDDDDAGSTPAEGDDDDDAGSTPAEGDDDDDAGSTPGEGDDDDDAGSTPAEGDDDDDAGSNGGAPSNGSTGNSNAGNGSTGGADSGGSSSDDTEVQGIVITNPPVTIETAIPGPGGMATDDSTDDGTQVLGESLSNPSTDAPADTPVQAAGDATGVSALPRTGTDTLVLVTVALLSILAGAAVLRRRTA